MLYQLCTGHKPTDMKAGVLTGLGPSVGGQGAAPPLAVWIASSTAEHAEGRSSGFPLGF